MMSTPANAAAILKPRVRFIVCMIPPCEDRDSTHYRMGGIPRTRSAQREMRNNNSAMRTSRLLRVSRFALLVLLCAAFSAIAHDIPNDVRVIAFVKPSAQQLHV